MTGKLMGKAPTAHASRYLQQLCKHWSHRFEVSFDPQRGRIALPGCLAELEAADDALHVTLSLGDLAGAARMRGVVEEHLNRFAHREAPLPFTWSEPGSEPGTEAATEAAG